MEFGNKLADYLRQGADALANFPTEAQRFLTNPQAFTQLVTGKNPLPKETGFVAGATGLPAKNPVQGGVLNPAAAPYQEGYEQGEPVAIAGMAVPAYATALRAGAPKMADAIGNYMVKTGGIQPMFIGPESKMWDAKSAFQASKLEKQGVSPEEILRQTGTSRGLDNQFRQEISDEKALIKGGGKFGDVYEQRKTAYGVTTPTVDEVLRHPELFEAYPQLKGNQVMLLPANSRNNASYSPVEGIIRVNPNLTADQARSSMLHELQHGVQEIEGFNKGTDAGIFLKKYQEQADELEERLMQANKDLKLHAGGKYYDDLLKERDAIGKEYRDFMGADQQGVIRKATKEYKAYGGEAEARLTQARQKLTADQRKGIFPFAKGESALDINPEDAIIKMENNSPTITRKELLQQLMESKK